MLCSYVIPNVADDVQTRENCDVLKVTVCFRGWPDTDHVQGNIRWYVREGGSRWTWRKLHCTVLGLSDISFWYMHCLCCVFYCFRFHSLDLCLIEVFVSMLKKCTNLLNLANRLSIQTSVGCGRLRMFPMQMHRDTYRLEVGGIPTCSGIAAMSVACIFKTSPRLWSLTSVDFPNEVLGDSVWNLVSSVWVYDQIWWTYAWRCIADASFCAVLIYSLFSVSWKTSLNLPSVAR